MEYVVIKAVHPSWLTSQLPDEVVGLLCLPPVKGPDRDPTAQISFLARGPGIARVIALPHAREPVAVETVRGRLLSTAGPLSTRVFSIPSAVIRHLGLRVYPKGNRGGRGTDDRIIWFAPASEYYEYVARVRTRKEYTGPSSGPFAHVYLMRSLVPFPREMGQLAELELRIEEEEWKPAVDALQRVGRGRRVVL